MNYHNYQNLMLLTSSNTKRTLMHLFLFTNSAQRERVTAINFPSLIPSSVVQYFEMSKEKGLGWIYKVPLSPGGRNLLQDSVSVHSHTVPGPVYIYSRTVLDQFTNILIQYLDHGLHTFSYTVPVPVYIHSHTVPVPAYIHSHTVPGPWYTYILIQ